MTQIDVVIYSYKNKNLKRVIDSLLSNTRSEIKINVFDQHPLDRSKNFINDKIIYKHIFWDIIQSPCEYRGSVLDSTNADYVLQISDDVLVSPGWDLEMIDFIKNNNYVISGNQSVEMVKSDKFSLLPIRIKSNEHKVTNYIDRNFIFASTENWNSFEYPYYLKYNGEEEMLSLEFFLAKKDIYQAPTRIYEDINLRTLDNLYVPFSKDHCYNLVVESINSRGSEFLAYHNLGGLRLAPLPYQTNDVSYNPYNLEFQDIDARKFISKTKAIY